DRRAAERCDRRLCVVVHENLVVRPPVQREALRAVLAHADSMAPAVTRLEEHGRGGRRGRGEREREKADEEKAAHFGTPYRHKLPKSRKYWVKSGRARSGPSRGSCAGFDSLRLGYLKQ